MRAMVSAADGEQARRHNSKGDPAPAAAAGDEVDRPGGSAAEEENIFEVHSDR